MSNTPPIFSPPSEGPLQQFGRVTDLVHHFPSWFWHVDAAYCLTYLSHRFYELYNVRREDIEGVCILDFDSTVQGVGRDFGSYRDKLIAHEPLDGVVYEKHLVNGKRAILMDSALPVFDEQGAFTGYQGITLDLTHVLSATGVEGGLIAQLRSRAEALEKALSQRNKDLARSNRSMSDVLNAMGEGLLVTSGEELHDPENRVLYVNPAYRRLFGFSDDEVYPGCAVGRIVELLNERGDASPEESSKVNDRLRNNGSMSLTVTSLNRTVYVRNTLRPGGGFILVHTDVSEMQERQQALVKSRREAQVANAAKSHFLAAMSHEIRTPMNGIVGMTDLLADTNLNEEQAEYVETIRNSALALTSLISDVLDFSKIEAGRMELYAAPFSLVALCRDVCALMRPMAEAKGLTFDLEIDPDMPHFYFGDGPRIRQILLNLLGNAIKFTLKGEVRLAAKGEGTGDVIIDVLDTGIGIPEDKIDGIFSAFEQAQGGLQRAFEGTGLGLSITQQLVGRMNGQIEVTSRGGVGTTFRVTLPLDPAPEPKEPENGGNEDEIDLAHLRGLSVLVAEDNKTNQVVVRKMLERLGVTSTIVGDGQAAVREARKGIYDAVLMDVSMPLMSGLEASRHIRDHEARDRRLAVPIIAVSGNAFEKDHQAAFEAGMDDFVSKPLRMQALGASLRRNVITRAPKVEM